MRLLRRHKKKLKKALHKLLSFTITFKPLLDFVKAIQDIIKNFK